MKKVLFLVLLLVSIHLIIANAELQETVYPYLKTGETYKDKTVRCENQKYELILINDKETFVLEKRGDRYYFVEDKETIYDVLNWYYVNYQKITPEIQFENLYDVKEDIEHFFEDRKGREDECEQYTGIDRLPCYDRDTCLVACRTVYICDTYSFGIGMDFIDLILDFKQNIDSLDEAETKQEEIFNETMEGKDLDALDKYEVYIDEIKTSAEDIENNEMITTYDFCPEIEYSIEDLTSAKTTISEIRETINPLFEINNTVDYIYQETTTRNPDFESPEGAIKILKFGGRILNVFYLIDS